MVQHSTFISEYFQARNPGSKWKYYVYKKKKFHIWLLFGSFKTMILASGSHPGRILRLIEGKADKYYLPDLPFLYKVFFQGSIFTIELTVNQSV